MVLIQQILAVSVITAFFFISQAGALDNFDDIFDILDTDVVSNAWELEQDPDIFLPDTSTTTLGHITAWLDIVGFDNMTSINDVNYVPGFPVNYTIVLYGLSHDIKGEDWWNWRVDSLEGEIVLSETGGNVTATLTTTLIYYEAHLICNPTTGTCRVKKDYYTDVQVFNDTEIAPNVYDYPDIGNVTGYVTVYNNTVSPKTRISVDRLATYPIVGIAYHYDNQSIVNFPYMCSVALTEKNVAYINLISADHWKDGNVSDNLSRISSMAQINGPGFNSSMLNITIADPYQVSGVSNIQIEKINYSPEKAMSPGFFLITTIIGTLFWGTRKIIRRFT